MAVGELDAVCQLVGRTAEHGDAGEMRRGRGGNDGGKFGGHRFGYDGHSGAAAPSGGGPTGAGSPTGR